MEQILKGFQNTFHAATGHGVTVTTLGKIYDLENINADNIDVEQMCRVLSRINRYTGNTNEPYSVAQHVYYGTMAYILVGDLKKARLFYFHEISEAFVSDVIRPLKSMIGERYEQLEEKICKTFALKFGYDEEEMPSIKVMDKNLAQYEMATMMFTKLHQDYWDSEKAFSMLLDLHSTLELFDKFSELDLSDTKKSLGIEIEWNYDLTIPSTGVIIDVNITSKNDVGMYTLTIKCPDGELVSHNIKRDNFRTLFFSGNPTKFSFNLAVRLYTTK